jgi:acyl-CoA thioester hydrolase
MTAPTTQVRVIYADTDKMGVVNNVHYLRYFEIGRAEWIRQRGKPYRQIEDEGWLLPVIEAHVRYRAPARYDDLLDIHAHVDELRAASLRFSYAIKRHPDGALLCEGYTKHACLDAKGNLRRFPEELLVLLAPR